MNISGESHTESKQDFLNILQSFLTVGFFFAISTGLNNSSWFSDLLKEWEGLRVGNGIKTFDPRSQVSSDKVRVQLTFQYFLPEIHFSVIMNVSVALSQFHGLRSP